MIITKRHLNRRTMLRGMGASIALPLLDAMVPALTPTALAAPPVRRFGALYIAMGMSMPTWRQSKAGALDMNTILQVLEPHKDLIVVADGLDNEGAVSVGDNGNHPRAQAAWLTGAHAKKTDGPDIELGVSLDQIIARQTEKETQIGSMELAIEATDLVGNCAYGFSCAYNNTIAWRTKTTPLPMENNPRNVFERLFGASGTTDPKVRIRQLKMDSSILDSVTADVAGMRKGLASRDIMKLTEYLDAVRDVERRIQKAEDQATREMPIVAQPIGVPPTYEEHARLLFDLQLLAFQTDLTRVFTFVLARESSTRSYPEIGVSDSHHPLSHHQNNPEKLARLAKLNAFHLKQLGYFIDRLQATKDGNGTLLDSTMLLYGSGMSDSNMHLPRNVPTLLVSGKSYGIKGNRSLKFDEGTPLCNFQLTMAEKFGLDLAAFGNSTGDLKTLAI
jgi:hypothetical protein